MSLASMAASMAAQLDEEAESHKRMAAHHRRRARAARRRLAVLVAQAEAAGITIEIRSSEGRDHGSA